MEAPTFDDNGSVHATVDWVASFLGSSDYSVALVDEAVNGSALRRLAKDITGLKLLGFKSGHAANLLDYFERLAIQQTASSSMPQAVPTTPSANPLTGRTVHTQQTGSEQYCSQKDLHQQQRTIAGVTYKQIFKEKAAGKALLRERYLLAWKNLHAGHAIIRSWFRNYETDTLQFELLHENYRLNPEMKGKLNLFVSERISQLPRLVLAPNSGGDTGTMSFDWKHETVYLHIIAHRQEFKKGLKRRRCASTADDESEKELPPKRERSRPGIVPDESKDEETPAQQTHATSSSDAQCRARPANLSEDEPDMMSLIMKGGKFALYVLKDRPTVPRIKMRELGTTPADAVESVEFIGFGEPTEVSQKTPYKAYKVQVTDLVRGYSNRLSKFYVPHVGTTTGEILPVQQLTVGCVIEYAQCYVTLMEEDKVFDRLMKLEWTAKPSNTDRGATEDASEIRSLQNDAKMVSQSLDEQS
ncbi:hypothetical protein R1sor_018484 [Riccia sorocarpa]|uniref:SAM domain-containing protein n=1 Tax=Riccia sorocarpa TaxID=122646 RepID=A0ABD3ICJ3_9MARC